MLTNKSDVKTSKMSPIDLEASEPSLSNLQSQNSKVQLATCSSMCTV